MCVPWMTSYDVWFLRYEVRQTELFDILGHFLSFYPNNNPENQNFEKMEKKPEDTILLHKCNINHDHMLYCFWDTMCADVIFIFHFGLFFQSFTPQQPTKSKLKKWEKNRPGDIIILHMCAKHYDHMMYGSSDMVCNRWSDRQTDRPTDKVTYRGGEISHIYFCFSNIWNPYCQTINIQSHNLRAALERYWNYKQLQVQARNSMSNCEIYFLLVSETKHTILKIF